jgi:murein DD-endopeptidase MepM/ murein hydrolase activator NlpD
MKLKIIAAIFITVIIASVIPIPSASSQMGGGFTCGRVESVGGAYFFKPYGSNDLYDWWPIDWTYGGVYVYSDDGYLDLNAVMNQSLHVWMPETDPATGNLIGIAGYDVVSTCEPVFEFYLERETIAPGECTVLHWLVDNVSSLNGIFLNGEIIDPGEGSRPVCVMEDTSYNLELNAGWGGMEQTVTVYVRQPTSTSLPPTLTPPPTTPVAVQPTVVPAPADNPPVLPIFKLPYAKGVKVYWTGGPHAYLLGGYFSAKYPSGQGSGLDFSNNQSFQVLAMADGMVIDSSCNNPGLGCQVAIKHYTGGSVLVYGHLTKASIGTVVKGQSVRQGDVIGMSGNTGSGGGPYIHLHIELRDGSGSCQVQCMPDLTFGNPIGWDDLVQLVDGWYIGGYLADAEGLMSYNYDGSAVRDADMDVFYEFSYMDNGVLQSNAIARVGKGFQCKQRGVDCELHGNNTNPGGKTQFARDDGKGAVFPAGGSTSSNENSAGYLASSNLANGGSAAAAKPSIFTSIINFFKRLFGY